MVSISASKECEEKAFIRLVVRPRQPISGTDSYNTMDLGSVMNSMSWITFQVEGIDYHRS